MKWPFMIRIEVRFRDLDAMGHVNNAVYLTYFETARSAYYRRLTGKKLKALEEFDFILAEVTCSFRSSAYFGETLLVSLGVTEIGTRSFVFEYEVTEEDSNRLVATGRSVQVMYDYAAKKTKPIPSELRGKMVELEGRPIATKQS
ncbi:MAG: acyl-CoA thioesterase [Acidobacteriota bacterium]